MVGCISPSVGPSMVAPRDMAAKGLNAPGVVVEGVAGVAPGVVVPLVDSSNAGRPLFGILFGSMPGNMKFGMGWGPNPPFTIGI